MRNRMSAYFHFIMAAAFVLGAASVQAQPGIISYQGRLLLNGEVPVGAQDMEFSLWTAGIFGTQVASTVVVEDVQPSGEGFFTVKLNFGSGIFTGEERWLRVGVKPANSGGAYTYLVPRTQMTAAPFAAGIAPGARSVDGLSEVTINNGFSGLFISNSQGSGMQNNNSTASAYYTFEAGTTAFNAQSPLGRGLYVTNAGSHGVDAETDSAAHYAGFFTHETGDAIFANGVRNGDADIQLGANDGVIHTDRSLPGSDAILRSHDEFWVFLDDDNNDSDSSFRVYNNGSSGLLFKVDNVGNVSADGSYTSPAADFAELLPAVAGLEAGDVLAVSADGLLVKSGSAFDAAVVGIYSTKPAFLGGASAEVQEIVDLEGMAGVELDTAVATNAAIAARGNEVAEIKVPLAIMGIVPVKVTDENGPIVPGQMLAASSTPGHAMAAGTDAPQGTVLGKALSPLASGSGVIKMLVTLQ